MEDQNRVFQQLKPPCVELSQAALALNGPRGDVSLVTKRLEEVHRILKSTSARSSTLDEKLADYVFFPLSNVLKSSQKISLRCLELSLESIAVLIEKGWRSNIQPQLAAQLIILCTLMSEKHPKNFSFSESTGELQQAAFNCLRHIFEAASSSPAVQEILESEANFPQLGQSISNILEGIASGESAEVQISATRALISLFDSITDRELSASFLPGIVSRLTKILTPSTQQRRNHQVLIGCVRVLQVLLKRTLGDLPVNDQKTSKSSRPRVIDQDWLENAARQLRTALTSVYRQNKHDKENVRQAVSELCLAVLTSCRGNLENCAQLSLESLIAILAKDERAELGWRIQDVPAWVDLLQNTIYEWLQSLPTIMQSSDLETRSERLRLITCGYQLLVDTEADTAMLDRTITANLRDAVSLTLHESLNKTEQSVASTQVQSFDLIPPTSKGLNYTFGPALVHQKNSRDILGHVEGLVKILSRQSSSLVFASDLLRDLRFSQNETQLTNFWLLLTSIQQEVATTNLSSAFIDLGPEDSPLSNDYLEDLYSYALSVLTESDDEVLDPRLRMLALRTVALRAQMSGEDFRLELVDVLYPVLHALATPDESLQQDSITTLNIITRACSYDSVESLIVENVDYLVNAVALKLNSFDLSPQAPQVLLAMVRLAGPKLLPYLEDTVESIFAALEDYHGYPLLVELLFRVLRVMAEEGVKSPRLAIANAPSPEMEAVLREKWRPITIDNLVDLIKEQTESQKPSHHTLEPHPQQAWGKPKPEQSESETIDELDDPDAGSDQEGSLAPDDTDLPAPAPRTYALLLKISTLTQHFLPSASPTLTTSLLSLLRISIPSLALHENSFLPLINTLWPEISARLDDDEMHVQVGALHVIAVLCTHAGDFMSGRVVEVWPRLREMYRGLVGEIVASVGANKAKVKREAAGSSSAVVLYGEELNTAVARMRRGPADYSNTSARMLWEAMVELLVVVGWKVGVPPNLFDEVVEMVGPVLEDEQVRGPLERENADAVWLARVRSRRGVDAPERPIVPDGKEWRFAEIKV